MSDNDSSGSEQPIGLQRKECWRCGYDRLIYESCPECGGSCKPLNKREQRSVDTDTERGGADE